MNRKFLKKILAGLMLLLCVVSLSACGKHNTTKKVKDTSLPTGEYFASTSQAKQMGFQRHKMLGRVASQMGQNYKKLGNVNYNKTQNSISLNLKGAQMSNLVQAAHQHNKQALKFWQQLTTGMNKSSKVISNQTQDNGLKFKIFDTNQKPLYVVSNGNVSQNAFK